KQKTVYVFSSRRRHTRFSRDWSSDVCSSDLYPKSSFPDLIPSLEINGIKHTIVEKLPWPQYALALLPMILIFIGGGLGGAIGAVSTIYNLQIFRTKDSDIIKYLNVVAVSILAYIAYLVTAYLFFTLIN